MSQILVPFDFSKNAIKALDQAILIAAAGRKKLEVMHITNSGVAEKYPKSWKYDGKTLGVLVVKVDALVEDRITKLDIRQPVKTSVFVKESATISGGIISRMLQLNAELLVMGTHGMTGVYERFFGSNTSALVNHCLFPVLVIPHNWKPVKIEHTVALIKLQKLQSVSSSLKSWSRFFKSTVEAIHFTISYEAEGEYANKNKIGGIPCKLVLNPPDTTLAEDILTYSRQLKRTMLVLFTREKSFFEKLLVPNLSYNLSGKISIPLLTLPLEKAVEK